MFETYHRMKNTVDVSFDDFFTDSPVHVTKGEPKPRRPLSMVAKNLGVFMLIAALCGTLTSVWPILALSQGVQAAEPIAEYWKSLPENLEDIEIGQKNTLLDINGTPYAEVRSENRTTLTSLDQVSDYAKKGLIATED